MKEQNIYDNNEFFENYQKLRQNKGLTANDLIETPQLFELIGDVKDKEILDLGCGAGNNDRKLIEKGAKSLLGIDLSKKMIEVANKENDLDNIEYKVMSMNDINKIKLTKLFIFSLFIFTPFFRFLYSLLFIFIFLKIC